MTAAELLSVAAFREGRFSQAFPSFGSERMGAPVAAFCRVSDREIRTREPVSTPDAVVVADSTLVHQVDVLGGLSESGYVVLNASRGLARLGLEPAPHRAVVPATELALAHIGRPVPGAALLGALAALTGVVALDSLCRALRDRFSGAVAEGNVAAAVAGYQVVQAQMAEAQVEEKAGA